MEINTFKYFDVTAQNPIILKINQKANNIIYHYTNIKSFCEIIKNEEIWVTDSNFLNDSLEIKYIRKIMLQVANCLEENKGIYSNKSDSNGELLDMFIKVLLFTSESMYERSITAAKTFIFSLSENDDSLDLFRCYSNGEGIAIGFKNIMQEVFKYNFIRKNKILIFDGNVIYDEVEQNEILKSNVLEFYNELVNTLISKNIKVINDKVHIEILNEVKSIISILCFNYSIFFKDKSFKSEQEYRIAFLMDSEVYNKFVKFRVKGDIIIPYIEMKFNRKYIEKIVLSPSNDFEFKKMGIEILLKKYNNNSLIIQSDSPYR